MKIAILTVGDELLAGETENTNASWLARQLAERGASVARILVVPDETDTIAAYVREWSAEFDAVAVTGGLGGTHDDVTMDAVAVAFDREVVVDPDALEAVTESARAFADSNPDIVDEYDLDIDLEAWAEMPDGARMLDNPAGLAPGCVLENVYVFPGVPDEMRATFAGVSCEFGGDAVSETVYTDAPEGALVTTLEELRDRFDVVVGSYPAPRGEPNRVKVTATDRGRVDEATAWLRERIQTVPASDANDR
ncbi:competence/damage-inducible protein A [Halorarum halophilum]|uniref:Competence/damage-inducible protein A n=1 Tax=Halorarum halophilum TaxID=2743090 RepID=A0A7D5KE29_9EURY|nr:molybdopterin-binding protein [Halobaculum halophilum]QLG26496.1 competence/damage-inducible protein A [Halobaculum halophilum]